MLSDVDSWDDSELLSIFHASVRSFKTKESMRVSEECEHAGISANGVVESRGGMLKERGSVKRRKSSLRNEEEASYASNGNIGEPGPWHAVDASSSSSSSFSSFVPLHVDGNERSQDQEHQQNTCDSSLSPFPSTFSSELEAAQWQCIQAWYTAGVATGRMQVLIEKEQEEKKRHKSGTVGGF